MFARAARQLARNGRKFSSQARPRVNAAASGRGPKVTLAWNEVYLFAN